MSQVFLTDGPSPGPLARARVGWPAGQGKKHGLIFLFLLSVFFSVRGKMVGLSLVCLSPGPEARTGWRKAREAELR